MLTRLSLTIDRIASPRSALLLFVCLLPFVYIFFPWRSRQLSARLTYPLRLFDVYFPYTPQQVHALAADLGEPGRRLYALSEVTLDFTFPLFYATWLGVTLAWVWRRVRPERTGRFWPVLVPYLGMLGDYGENTCLAALMLLFPQELSWLMWLSNLASLVKWSAGLATLGMIGVGIGLLITRLLSRRG